MLELEFGKELEWYLFKEQKGIENLSTYSMMK